VIVVNAEKVRVTGRKAAQKMYYSHSGHPGSLKETNFEKMQKENPEKIIYLAVRNMLPDNKLRALWLKRLEIKKGNDAN
jgi:large subunit ribosomal protein L13